MKLEISDKLDPLDGTMMHHENGFYLRLEGSVEAIGRLAIWYKEEGGNFIYDADDTIGLETEYRRRKKNG